MGLTNKECAKILETCFSVEMNMYAKYSDYISDGFDLAEALKRAIEVLKKTPDEN